MRASILIVHTMTVQKPTQGFWYAIWSRSWASRIWREMPTICALSGCTRPPVLHVSIYFTEHWSNKWSEMRATMSLNPWRSSRFSSLQRTPRMSWRVRSISPTRPLGCGASLSWWKSSLLVLILWTNCRNKFSLCNSITKLSTHSWWSRRRSSNFSKRIHARVCLGNLYRWTQRLRCR